MAVDAFSREIFARTLWMEARGEDDEGLQWCAHSIYNRFCHPKWYSTFTGRTTLALSCLYDQQYSSWNASKDDKNREAMAVLDDGDSTLVRCRVFCDRVIYGEADPTDGATHYFDARLPEWPSWADKATLVAQKGHHRFYKDVP